MSDDGPRSHLPPSSAGPEHDAWLRQALRHAPDASASPPPSLSDAILAEARAATRAGAGRPSAAPPSSPSLPDRALAFWSWLARPPVAAGFASVMAATLVGMLWWDRPMDETMLPPPSSPAVTAPRSAQESGDVAGQRQSPPVDPDTVAAQRADRLPVPMQPPAPASAPGLRETAPAPAKTAAPRAAAEAAAIDAERKQQVARAAADDRARSQAEEKRSAKAEASRKDDKPAQAPPPSTPQAPATAAAPPPAPAGARPAAEAPSPFPARSPTEDDAAPRPAAPAVAPPSPTMPDLRPPAPAEGRVEPFALAKKAEPGEKEGAATRARPVAPASEQQASAAGALGGATLDSSEASSTGRAAAQNAAGPAARRQAAPLVSSPRPLAPLLAALASEEARWSRRLANGESAAADAALRLWLAQVQSAASRWEAASDRLARRDLPAASSPTATLRLERDGRAAAIVQVEDGGVLFDPLSGSVWFAPLPPEAVGRLRATLPPAPR